MSDDKPDAKRAQTDNNAVPEPPEEIADYDLGSAADALANEGDTKTVWVADHDREVRWWFKVVDRVPVRRKQKIVEENTTATNEGVNVSSDYYIDMLEFMVEDWSGANDADAPGLRELLTGAYRTGDAANPVFEELWEEVPPPFGTDMGDIDAQDDEKGKE